MLLGISYRSFVYFIVFVSNYLCQDSSYLYTVQLYNTRYTEVQSLHIRSNVWNSIKGRLVSLNVGVEIITSD